MEELLGTFVKSPGVEPTNNQAEREHRHAVPHRKISGDADGEGGGRFVERILTARARSRLQGIGLLDHLTTCSRAGFTGEKPTSLMPRTPPAASAA